MFFACIDGFRRRASFAESLHHLSLKRRYELLVTFVRDDGQDIYLFIGVALTLLIYHQSHAATDFLAFLDFRNSLIERANLADVRIVPTFAQRAVRENEADRLVKRQQPFFVFHDEVVCSAILGALTAYRIDAVLFASPALFLGKIT